MNVIEEDPEPHWGLLIWLIVSQLLAAGTLCYWFLVAGLSVMVFDQGYSQNGMIFVTLVWLYPIFPITMAIGAWIAYKRHKNTLSAILSGLTFIPLILFLAVILLFTLLASA